MKCGWSFVVAVVASVSLAWASEPAKVTLKVEGMTCGGCVATVKVQLEKTEGVTAYEISLERGEAAVSYDPTKTTPETIAESVSKTGFPASVKKAARSASSMAAIFVSSLEGAMLVARGSGNPGHFDAVARHLLVGVRADKAAPRRRAG